VATRCRGNTTAATAGDAHRQGDNAALKAAGRVAAIVIISQGATRLTSGIVVSISHIGRGQLTDPALSLFAHPRLYSGGGFRSCFCADRHHQHHRHAAENGTSHGGQARGGGKPCRVVCGRKVGLVHARGHTGQISRDYCHGHHQAAQCLGSLELFVIGFFFFINVVHHSQHTQGCFEDAGLVTVHSARAASPQLERRCFFRLLHSLVVAISSHSSRQAQADAPFGFVRRALQEPALVEQ
jgi:hypothetical protein